MALTNAEHQKRWRERHRDHVRVSVPLRAELERLADAREAAEVELGAARVRLAELSGTPKVALRLAHDVPEGENLTPLEQHLDRFCRASYSARWLALVVLLFDRAGPDTVAEAMRRYIAAQEAKAAARLAKEKAREARKQAKEREARRQAREARRKAGPAASGRRPVR
jgi:hypothetical protein